MDKRASLRRDKIKFYKMVMFQKFILNQLLGIENMFFFSIGSPYKGPTEAY